MKPDEDVVQRMREYGRAAADALAQGIRQELHHQRPDLVEAGYSDVEILKIIRAEIQALGDEVAVQ